MISDFVNPNRCISNRNRQYIILGWLVVAAICWAFSPFVFLPRPGEVWQSLHDLWFDQALGIELLSSLSLNFEAVAIATAISLGLAYASTIATFRPIAAFVGQLRFLSFAGLGFAFTLMTHSGHALKVSVLVFMVVVYFVIAMMDIIGGIPVEQYDLARTLKMGDWETLYEVVILGQLDQAFIVVRQTAAMSFMMIATAETMAMSGGGVGVLLFNASRHFHLADIMALQMMVLALGLCQDYAIQKLRNICCPWVKR